MKIRCSIANSDYHFQMDRCEITYLIGMHGHGRSNQVNILIARPCPPEAGRSIAISGHKRLLDRCAL
jgi:ABC-type ATPase involved in cell division